MASESFSSVLPGKTGGTARRTAPSLDEALSAYARASLPPREAKRAAVSISVRPCLPLCLPPSATRGIGSPESIQNHKLEEKRAGWLASRPANRSANRENERTAMDAAWEAESAGWKPAALRSAAEAAAAAKPQMCDECSTESVLSAGCTACTDRFCTACGLRVLRRGLCHECR